MGGLTPGPYFSERYWPPRRGGRFSLAPRAEIRVVASKEGYPHIEEGVIDRSVGGLLVSEGFND